LDCVRMRADRSTTLAAGWSFGEGQHPTFAAVPDDDVVMQPDIDDPRGFGELPGEPEIFLAWPSLPI